MPNLTSIRSVPADTKVREEWINNWWRLGSFQGVMIGAILMKLGRAQAM